MSTKRKTPDAPRAIKAGDLKSCEPRAEKTDEAAVPEFAALDAAAEGRVEYRKVRVPAHRYTPLRKAWPQIVTPLVEQLKLQVRFNPRSRCVELRSAPTTPDAGAVQKGGLLSPLLVWASKWPTRSLYYDWKIYSWTRSR